MSTTESEIHIDVALEFVVRSFNVELTEAEGRTLIGRCVPYNERALVADPPDYEPYYEEWLPGVFDHQLNAANRVLLDFEHFPGLDGILGRSMLLRSEHDGFWSEFKVYDNARGDLALEMYHDGVLTGLSVYAKPKKNQRAADGTVQRVKAHLDKVALCRQGAFENAKVLAVRTDQQLENEALIPEFDEGLAESFARAGLVVPDELQSERLREQFNSQQGDGNG